MSLVRSKQLGWVISNTVNGAVTVALVPAGHRYLVKTLHVVNGHFTLPVTATVRARNAVPTLLLNLVSKTLAANELVVLTPGIVLEAGESLQLIRGAEVGPFVHVMASGIDFTLV